MANYKIKNKKLYPFSKMSKSYIKLLNANYLTECIQFNQLKL